MARETERLPNLDGLRAVALLAVVFSHSRAFFAPEGFIRGFCGYFNQGVDLFFAISGLLITTLLYREFLSTGAIRFRAFYVRRAFRILPPLMLCLSVVAMLGAIGLIKVEAIELVSSLFFFRNYVSLIPYGVATTHFWTLSVEEHFYLFWPLCLFLLLPKRAVAFGLMTTVAIAVWRGLDARFHLFAHLLPDAGNYFRSDTRLDAILWGAIVGLTLSRLKTFAAAHGGAILVPLLLGFIVIINVMRIAFAPTFLAVAFATLVASCVVYGSSIWTRWLANPLLSWIGALSYSLYIWQSLFLQTDLINGRWTAKSSGVLLWLLDIALTLLCAVGSFYLVEQPLRRIGYRVAGGRVVTPAKAEIAPVTAV